MQIKGFGVLVSKDQFTMDDEQIAQIMSRASKALDLNLSDAEFERLSLSGRCQLLSLSESDFQTVVGAGYQNIARYLAKYVMDIDETTRMKTALQTKFLAWEQEHSPWGKDVFGCLFYV